MTAESRRRLRDLALKKFADHVEEDPERHHALRVVRVRAGLTTKELAQMVDTVPGTIGDIERGRSPGSRSTRKRIGRVLGVDVSSIFGAPL